MDWTRFENHGESNQYAFEVMCKLIFESWSKRIFPDKKVQVTFVNGEGGDGGVEAYANIEREIIGLQAKWFRNKIMDSQINQIKDSFLTAVKVRPTITKYIVCIPRDFGSNRLVKGKKVSKNSEESRWIKLTDEMRESYPNVTIELWNETRIQDMLTWSELQGAYKFWFGNIVFDDQFKLSFQRAVNSWAKPQYVPDLYAEGFIHSNIELFLGSYELAEDKYKALIKLIKRLEDLALAYRDILANSFPESETDIVEDLEKDANEIKRWLHLLNNQIENAKSGRIVECPTNFTINCDIERMKSSSLYLKHYLCFHDAQKLLEKLVEEFYGFQSINKVYDDNRIIFLGNPGCGKTMGIVSEVKKHLDQGIHLPILVHSKEFDVGETWCSIIQKTLGLSGGWDEKELFYALQCSAEIAKNMNTKEYDIEAKCVICVDGLDESASFEFWRIKIEEAVVYKEIYPRIKFIFLSRPYVFEQWFDMDYRKCFYHIPSQGDVCTSELCSAYFKKYKITTGKNNWIKKFLKTPLSVKLFCDIYKGKSVEKLSQNTTVITNLFHKRIELLDERYKKLHPLYECFSVSSVLCEIAYLFSGKRELTYEEIQNGVGQNARNRLPEILSFFIEEGFVYEYKRKIDEFSPEIRTYSWGMQPAFDYLIAQKIKNVLVSGGQITTQYTIGIYNMLAIIILEEQDKFLSEYGNIEIEDEKNFELSCYSLENASIESVVKHQQYLKNIMKESVDHFRYVVNHVVIPVSGIEKHPLGAMLLDDVLRGFTNPAERDIWWSIPSSLIGNEKTNWKANEEIGFEEISIEDDDGANTVPLVLAWSLSSVNNDVRYHSRKELICWGLHNPEEFWKLFLYISNVDDEQILEDMLAIAYGIALDQFVKIDYLREASDWILRNVFSEKGLQTIINSAIRYYCSSIVKVAIAKGVVKNSVKKIITPPFKSNCQVKKLALEAVNAKRMGGFKAIDYDLARYVLCDYLDGFFRMDYHNNTLERNASLFIEKYRNAYGLHKLEVSGLIISMAYQYLKECGWKESVFWKFDEGENKGVDITIRNTYLHATHGARSNVMTVAEKYVWLARHRIECILANEIPSIDRSTQEKTVFIDDYSLLESFVNPYQDYVNDINRKNEEHWFHINLLANSDLAESNDKMVEKWMMEEKIPDFKTWIFDNGGKALIYSFTNVLNNNAGIEETLWISAGAVKEKEFIKLLECIRGYSEERQELVEVQGFCADQERRTYCSPMEACIVSPEKEIESSILLQYPDENIEVKKMISSCLTSDNIDIEKTFILPSLFVRKLVGIEYGDGFNYKDSGGCTVASFYKNGELLGTQQEILLIDQDILMSRLKGEEYKPFWLFRVYRSPSGKLYERYPRILHDTDVTYLIWMEEDICYMKLNKTSHP